MRRDQPPSRIADVFALAKPTITATSVLTAAGGYLVAGSRLDSARAAALLIGVALVVAAANAFNMALERESDARMRRTRARPVASGRLSVRLALAIAGAWGALAALILSWGTNVLTSGLALASLVIYAFVYTPLKRKTAFALVIGAIPGAAPPLLGFTAATGEVGAPGLSLFALLFVWQLPHFLAIALRCREDYAAGGIRAISVVLGEDSTRRQAALYSAALIPTALSLSVLGVVGWFYAAAATILGIGMTTLAARAIRPPDQPAWDRRLFFASLAYLPLLFFALALDIS